MFRVASATSCESPPNHVSLPNDQFDFVPIQVCTFAEPLSAMTTVLARPLGGYGLTPLIFEPASQFMGLDSNSIETKVRKNANPVYELILPEYDDDVVQAVPMSKSKQLKNYSYESMVTKDNKPISAPSTNSYFSMADLFKGNNAYNKPMGPIGQSNKVYGKPATKSSYSSNAYSQPISAAIQSVRELELKDVQNSYENQEPQIIDIPPSALPIVINFRTSSSQIQIHQSHEPSEPAEVKQTQSEDKPQYLKHQVTKPVIQELHEIIMPYRRIIQEIRPVEEEVKTIVARAKKDRANKSKDEYNGSGKYGTSSQQSSYAAINSVSKKQSNSIANSKYKS